MYIINDKEQMQSLQDELLLTRTELEAERGLNANLLRIMRERNNAQRSLRPKKKLAGYIIKSSVQLRQKQVSVKTTAEEIFSSKDNTGNKDSTNISSHSRNRYTTVWKTVIETPFSCGLDLSVIEHRILEELDSILMPAFGISIRQDSEHNGEFRTWTDADGTILNGIYSWSFTMRPPYWQLNINHNLPLQIKEVNAI